MFSMEMRQICSDEGFDGVVQQGTERASLQIKLNVAEGIDPEERTSAVLAELIRLSACTYTCKLTVTACREPFQSSHNALTMAANPHELVYCPRLVLSESNILDGRCSN